MNSNRLHWDALMTRWTSEQMLAKSWWMSLTKDWDDSRPHLLSLICNVKPRVRLLQAGRQIIRLQPRHSRARRKMRLKKRFIAWPRGKTIGQLERCFTAKARDYLKTWSTLQRQLFNSNRNDELIFFELAQLCVPHFKNYYKEVRNVQSLMVCYKAFDGMFALLGAFIRIEHCMELEHLITLACSSF